MPSVSEKQHNAMEAAAHGHSTLGIPESVGKEFVKADGANVACAGILLRAPGPLYLLVKNADDGQWVQPGGHVDAGESLEDAAVRECKEEVGVVPDGPRWFLRSSQSGGIDFSCYIQDTKPFEPKLDDESTAFMWASPDSLPAGTHPEVAKSIALASGTELDIAKAIVSSELSSPQHYENIWLFDVRVTGTGTSYRQALDEYVYRPPEDFLSDDFVERCNGLPLIFEHPAEGILDTKEYRDRAIGMVILPYLKGDEVWGIAKVFDDDAAQLMLTSHISTSPAVVFRDAGSTETIELSDGKTVLIEGKPSYLDHLAICEEGVWDKGGTPNGVNINEDSTMANEDKAPAWADELGKRFDSMSARMDAIENKGGDKFEADSAKKDSFDGLEKKVEGEGYDKEAAEKIAGKVAEEKKAKADRKDSDEDREDARKDSEEERGEKEEKEEKKDARKDSDEEKEERKDRKDAQSRENADLRSQIRAMDARLNGLSQPLSNADRDALSAAQAKAEGVARLFGDSVNAPLHGESPIAYRKRLAAKFQKHSAAMKDARLDSLDGAAFDAIERLIYSDAQAVAMNPANAPKGRLIAHVRRDAAGRDVTSYTGDIDTWLSHFKSPGIVATINRNHNKGVN